ncbi:hypothetical protein HGH93_23545 [Chitinophaga polysaccharea]|uniref:hypothetical protein n=1 Tax=Chitinophaga polysaccharea TaxID=1293035 RepID=UPI0014551090|nr:hypothetical protein [Chitinophaga polysaccharea]NLR61096.1 hypothetical protein [Chitinophaga polysaccharea]
MYEDLTLGQWLETELHKFAKEKRKAAADNGMLVEIRTILEKHFSTDQFQIYNIDERKILRQYASQIQNIMFQDCQNPYEYLHDMIAELCFEIIIHFPEVEISNTAGDIHQIKDLFVKLYVNQLGELQQRNGSYLHGIRSTVTQEEKEYKYAHSHLPSTDYNPNNFDCFCLGRGPLDEITHDLFTKFNPHSFNFLCLYLKDYVRWESTEGTPYRYICDIGKGTGQNNTLGNVMAIMLDEILDIFLGSLKGLSRETVMDMFKVTAGNGEFNVSISDSGLDYLTSLLKSSPYNSDAYFSLLDRNNNYVRFSSSFSNDDSCHSAGEQQSILEELFTFNNKTVKFKITYNETKYNSARQYPHPDITRKITDYISGKLLEKYLLRNSI